VEQTDTEISNSGKKFQFVGGNVQIQDNTIQLLRYLFDDFNIEHQGHNIAAM
jgi:hypothetical protein